MTPADGRQPTGSYRKNTGLVYISRKEKVSVKDEIFQRKEVDVRKESSPIIRIEVHGIGEENIHPFLFYSFNRNLGPDVRDFIQDLRIREGKESQEDADRLLALEMGKYNLRDIAIMQASGSKWIRNRFRKTIQEEIQTSEKYGIYFIPLGCESMGSKAMVKSDYINAKINFAPILYHVALDDDLSEIAAAKSYTKSILDHRKHGIRSATVVTKKDYESSYEDVVKQVRKLCRKYNKYVMQEYGQYKNDPTYQHRKDFP